MSQGNAVVVQISKALPDFIGEGKFISESLLSRVLDQCCKGCTPQQAIEFLSVCAVRKLNPLTNQIYAVARQDRRNNTTKIVIQVGIDGLRDIAHRTGEFAGSERPKFGQINEHGIPDECEVTVYRLGRNGEKNAFVGVAYWDEFAPADLNAPAASMWKKFPKRMLEKCAESAALRKGFPSEVGGFYEPSEIENREIKDVSSSSKTASLNEKIRQLNGPAEPEAVASEVVDVPQGFVFPPGTKFQGKAIADVKPDDIVAYADGLEKWLEKNQSHKKAPEIIAVLQAITEHFETAEPVIEEPKQEAQNEAPL